jgi:hypothetical protein
MFIMNDQFEWKAEITFKGTADEFNEMTASLGGVFKTGRVAVNIPRWKKPYPGNDGVGGRMPFPEPLRERLNLDAITEGMPRVWLKPFPIIIGEGPGGGIAGGIRTPHLHLKEEVVLLDRERFKTFAGEIARELAGRHVDTTEDYVGVMNHIGRLAEGL